MIKKLLISSGTGICLGNSIGLLINGDKIAILGLIGAVLAIIGNLVISEKS